MQQITLTIRTLAPVILATQNGAAVLTGSTNTISGSVLQGVLAQLYRDAKGLAANDVENSDFSRLFLHNIRFITAMPVASGKRAITLPLSLQKNKKGNSILDLLQQKAPEGEVYKSCKGLAVIDSEKQTIYKVGVRKNISLHMSRNGEAERISGKSEDGNIYNYESIDANQTFQGAIYGEAEDLRHLAETIAPQGTVVTRIGRSKQTQYGLCQIQFGDIEPLSMTTLTAQHALYLRLDSPMIMRQAGTIDEFWQPFFKELHDTFHIQVKLKPFGTFAMSQEIKNFVRIWGMYRPVEQALGAGSVVTLIKDTTESWTEDEIQYIARRGYEGIGERTVEGFGQVRFWQPQSWSMADIPEDTTTPAYIESSKGRIVLQHILQQHIIEAIRIKARKDVEMATGIQNKTHMFAVLEQQLQTLYRKGGTDFNHTFAMQLRSDKDKDTRLLKHMKDIRLPGKFSLYQVLVEEKTAPQLEIDWKRTLPKQAETLAKAIQFKWPVKSDALYFYEYWKWFFRHGRKQSAQQKGDD